MENDDKDWCFIEELREPSLKAETHMYKQIADAHRLL